MKTATLSLAALARIHGSIRRLWIAAAVGVTLLTTSCGGGTNADSAKLVASVEIDQSALLLTAPNQTRRLAAQARDADGAAVDAKVTWISSTPDQVSVGADGTVRSVGSIGSAQVFAEVDGVRSAPVFVAIVELRPNTLLLRDVDVVSVGAPTNVANGAYPGLGTLYDVVVSGVAAPAAGTLVLGVEKAQVAGRVVGSVVEGSNVRLQLQLVSAPELLARYDVHWDIDLAGYELTMDNQAPSGALQRRLPSDRKQALADTNVLPRWKVPPTGDSPLKCVGVAKAFLKSEPVKVSFEGSPRLEIISSRLDDTLPPGRLRIALVGDMVMVTSVGLTAQAGLTGEVKCDLTGRIPLPFLPPPIGPFVRLAVPVGIGASITGTVDIASIDIGFEGKNGAHLELGIDCTAPAPCRSLDTAERINEFTPKARISSLPEEGLHIKLDAHVYLLSGIDVVAFVSPFSVVEIKAGPKQSADFGSVKLQAEDKTARSSYDLKWLLEAGPGSSLKSAITTLIGDDRGSLDASLKLTSDISESPNGTFAADRTTAQPGRDTVTLTVDLKPASLAYFLYGYNVKKVLIYRRQQDVDREFKLLATLDAAENQSSFQTTWTPEPIHAGKNEFAAFVVTKLPPVIEPELEVAPDSIREVKVDCVSAPNGSGRQRAQAASCSPGYVGTADGVITDVQRFNASVSWELDPVLMADPNRKGYEAFYRPSGSVHVDFTVYENLGCTVTPKDFGRFDAGSSILYISTATTPPSYTFGLQAHGDLRIDCPNAPTMTVPGANVLTINGAGALTDTGGIVGNNVSPAGSYSYAFRPGSTN